MERVFREVIAQFSTDSSSMRIEPAAVQALRVASEQALTEALSLANRFAVRIGKREGVSIVDFQEACRQMPHLQR